MNGAGSYRQTLRGLWQACASAGLLAAMTAMLFLGLHLLTSHAIAQAGPAGSVVLLMFDSPTCGYCRLWDRDIGRVYDTTPEGRFAPLVRRRIGDRDVAAIPNVRYTPTFVVLDDGREIGRIVGYPGPEFFWTLLQQLLDKAGFEGGAAPPEAPRPAQRSL
jgi:protein-disulfide isomerase